MAQIAHFPKNLFAYLDDAGLVPRDALDRVAQYVCVVNPNARDAAHDRTVDHVRRVVGAANTNFKDRNVHLLLEKDMEAEERQEAKVGRQRGRVVRRDRIRRATI